MNRIIALTASCLLLLLLVSGCKKHTLPSDDSADTSRHDDTPSKPGDGVTPVPDAIDLGVTLNGKNVKWASFNLGASSPEEFGLFLAFGALQENSPGYKMPLGASVTLPEEQDAAAVKLGGKWRMPVKEELDALLEQCDFTLDWIGTVRGLRFTSKKAGNTNSIFLPAGGYKNGVNYYYENEYGAFWSATVDREAYPEAYSFSFNIKGQQRVASGNYSDSKMIRPVMTD